MRLSFEFKTAATVVMSAAAAAVVSVSAVLAAPAPPVTGPYYGNYSPVESTSSNNPADEHVLWLPGFLDLTTNNDDNYWQFANSPVSSFNFTGAPGPEAPGTGTLSGTLVNNVDSNYAFNINYDFNYLGRGGAFGTPKCGSSCTAPSIYTDNFDYFSFQDIVLTGIDSLAGTKITINPRNDIQYTELQVGYGANDKDAFPVFGGSAWFSWAFEFIDLPAARAEATGNIDRHSGNGDFNFTLATAPIPPAAILLLGALGGLGYVSRRKRRAA